MATFLESFSNDELKMRYREPFLTAGLNAKFAVNTPRGVYRGFNLETNLNPNTITIAADSEHNDHSLVYETGSGYSLTIRKVGGDFSIDLAALGLVDPVLTKTWIIAVYATYAVGSITTAEIRAYEVSPTDTFSGAGEAGELVVLGSVVIPAANASAFPAANITAARRTFPWDTQAKDAVPWTPQVTNGSFDVGTGISIPYWRIPAVGSYTTFTIDTTNPRTGLQHLKFRAEAGTSFNTAATQLIGAIAPPGAQFRAILYKRVVMAAASGTASVDMVFVDNAGAETLLSVPFSITAIDASYVKVEGVVTAPTNSAYLDRVEIRVNADYTLTATPADSLYVDDLQVWASISGSPRSLREDVESATLKLTGTDAAVPRLLLPVPATAGVEYTLMWESVPPSMPGYRRYIKADGSLVETFNAYYNNSSNLWARDSAAAVAVKVTTNGTGTRFQKHLTSDPATWADGDLANQWQVGHTTISGDTAALQAITAVNPSGAGATVDIKNTVKLGAEILDTATEARDNARLKGDLFPGASNLTLVQHWKSSAAGTPAHRQYMRADDGLMMMTLNAAFDGTNWTKDVNGTEATRIVFGKNVFSLDKQNVATNTWAESAWSYTPFAFTASDIFGSGAEDAGPLLMLEATDGSANSGSQVPFIARNLIMDDRAVRYHEAWAGEAHYATITSFAKAPWTRTVSGTSPYTYMYGCLSQFGTKSIELNPGTGAGGSAQIQMNSAPFDVNDLNRGFIMRWWAQSESGVALGDQYMGLFIDQNENFTSDYIAVRRQAGQANWRFVLRDSGVDTQSYDIGVTNGTANVAEFCMVGFGYDEPTGTTQRIQLYVDGVLRATITNPNLGNDPIPAFRTAGTAADSLFVGNIILAWRPTADYAL